MKGSEKQVKWAQDIISNAMGTIDRGIEAAERQCAETYELYKIEGNINLTAWKLVKAVTVKAFGMYEDAGKLINNRHRVTPDFFVELQKRIAHDLKNGMAAEEIAQKLGVTEY